MAGASNDRPPDGDPAYPPDQQPGVDAAGETPDTAQPPIADDRGQEAVDVADPMTEGEPEAGAQEAAAPLVAVAPWSGLFIAAPALILTAIVTGTFLMFLLIEPSPRWIVLFGTAVTVASMDGVLRTLRRETFAAPGADTTPLLFLPALYVLATPVFIEHTARGFWVLSSGLLGGIGFGVLAHATLWSVRDRDRARSIGRLPTAGAAYFVAFALFSLTYSLELDRVQATAAIGLVAALLTIEVLREGDVDPLRMLLYAAVTGVVVGELRWVLHFLPLDGELGALTLVLALYFATGLMHAHLTRQLGLMVVLEYTAVVAAGLTLVVGVRVAGLA